jgi:menaquinol-cytochrome c reductase iron-sulfur subunit
VKRRQFLGFLSNLLGSAIGVVLAIPVVGYVLSPVFARREGKPLVRLTSLNSLTDGEVNKVDYVVKRVDGWFLDKTSRTVYVKRKGDEVIVFSSTCTHLGCGVTYNAEQKQFHCPCHGGVFDEDGRVVAGPPPQPLVRLRHKVQDGQVYAEEA